MWHPAVPWPPGHRDQGPWGCPPGAVSPGSRSPLRPHAGGTRVTNTRSLGRPPRENPLRFSWCKPTSPSGADNGRGLLARVSSLPRRPLITLKFLSDDKGGGGGLRRKGVPARASCKQEVLPGVNASLPCRPGILTTLGRSRGAPARGCFPAGAAAEVAADTAGGTRGWPTCAPVFAICGATSVHNVTRY